MPQSSKATKLESILTSHIPKGVSISEPLLEVTQFGLRRLEVTGTDKDKFFEEEEKEE